MMVQATEDMGADSATPTDSHSISIISQPSSSKPQKKKSRRKQNKDSGPTEPVTNEAHVSTPSYDLPQSGEDTKEITSLKKKVKQLEKRTKSRPSGLRQLRKVGSSSRVEYFNDASLDAQEDASKQGRKIEDLDADAEVTLVNETQEMNDDNLMFDTYVLEDAAEVVTTASANVEIPDELTFAQTLIEIKTAKPNPVTTAATTVTSVKPRAKGIIFHDQEEQVPASTKTFSSSQSQLPQVKDKGKGKMDNTQAMMEADFELAQRLQAEEQGEITIEERSRLFVELMNRRKKNFAKLRAEEIRRKPPTKAQKRNQMSTYLKNMAGFKHSQLKSKSYDKIQKFFIKEIKRVNIFVDINSEVVKCSETRTEESSKRAGDELESDMSKKQKIDEHVDVEKDDQEEAEMKRHIKIVKDDEIDKDGRMGYFKLIGADGSSKRPEDNYERVLWGDLKIQKMNIKFRGGLLGLKDFKMILRVTTAQLQLLSDYYCWKEYADRDQRLIGEQEYL
ncbi:hypothetical protein Tco_1281632 [Tanacetum coccineum]